MPNFQLLNVIPKPFKTPKHEPDRQIGDLDRDPDPDLNQTLRSRSRSRSPIKK